ncbi:MAG: hypothetical protein KIS68_07125 [Bauldia sp.]|nr:hypothetical protein [Bauldia sp.]
MADSLTFFCVLRAGRKYNAEHVARLQASVARNCTLPHRFVALSDVDVPCERVEFAHDWPTWWSKIELFRPGVADPAHRNVYIDLDVLIAGSLDAFVSYPHRFSMMRDEWFPRRANSSVMAWSGDYSFIYEEMVRHPLRYRFRFQQMLGNVTGWFGEQALTEYALRARGMPADRIDDLFPGCNLTIRSLPRHARKTVDAAQMQRALFVSFQGLVPKPGSPRQQNSEFIKQYWRR